MAGREHMFDNEVSILRSVDHTNIIRLISEHDTPTELYLIMELVTVRSVKSFAQFNLLLSLESMYVRT